MIRAYNQLQLPWLGYGLIVMFGLFFLAFTMGPGPLCYFVTTEMLNQEAKSAGQGWTAFVQMSR